MRSFRSRSVDDHTAALARARVAHVAGRRRAAGGTEPATTGLEQSHAWPDDGPDDGPGDGPDDGPDDGPELPPWERPARPAQWGERPGDPAPVDARPPAAHPIDPAPAVRSWRLGLERVQLAVIVLVVLVGAIGAAVLFLLARPEVVPIEPELVATGTAVDTGAPPPAGAATDGAPPHGAPPDGTPPAGPPDASSAATSVPIVVHVAGLVARPGVVELPPGSRVVDAIEAAGGATPDADLTPLNLARVLADGEQVLVTADPPAAAPPAPPAGGPGSATPSAPVNLNTATAAELETLPGIGPALADRILDWREQNGRFTSIDELREVAGIGEQRFAQLQPLVTL